MSLTPIPTRMKGRIIDSKVKGTSAMMDALMAVMRTNVVQLKDSEQMNVILFGNSRERNI